MAGKVLVKEAIPRGQVRDAIVDSLRVFSSTGATVQEIGASVASKLGRDVPESSIRSYLAANTPTEFVRLERGRYALPTHNTPLLFAGGIPKPFRYGLSRLYLSDCVEWLRAQPSQSVHAVVTDPPYGPTEYSAKEQAKRRSGRGGVWRVPPSFDGVKRSPVPRFTVASSDDLDRLRLFTEQWVSALFPCLVPGAHVFVASNPLLSYLIAGVFVRCGFERRGEIIRLVTTMRGGDRPKGAHQEYPDVTVMPRSMWEPWLLFRKPCEGTVRENLKKWHTGGLRRPSKERPFGDVIRSSPTRPLERELAPHPSLKPQAFLRTLVHAALPLAEGVVLDPFAGSGSTLAACEHVGYASIGVESDGEFYRMAQGAIPRLAGLDSVSR